MNFKNDMRKTTIEYCEKLNENAQKAGAFASKYKTELLPDVFAARFKVFDEERAKLINEGTAKLDGIVSSFKAELAERYTPNGADLTEDFKLLSGGLNLTESDIARLWDKPENNSTTMRSALYNYAENHGLSISRAYYTEAQTAEAADTIAQYCRGALKEEWRAPFVQDSKNFEKITPPALID